MFAILHCFEKEVAGLVQKVSDIILLIASEMSRKNSTVGVIPMFMHVTKASYRGDYKVWLSFNDGAEGEVDLSAELYGEIFQPLTNKEFFSSFALEGHTLSWANGADFAPEFLREQLP